jgi:hypothetical protein
MSEITDGETTEIPFRYTVTFTNGQTKIFNGPPTTVAVAANGALKVTLPAGEITWYSPSAWRSLDVQQLKA